MTPEQADAIRKASARVTEAARACLLARETGGDFVSACLALAGLRHMPGSGAIDHLIDALEAPAGRTEESRVWRVRRDHVRAVDPMARPGVMRREWLPELARLAATQPDDEARLNSDLDACGL